MNIKAGGVSDTFGQYDSVEEKKKIHKKSKVKGNVPHFVTNDVRHSSFCCPQKCSAAVETDRKCVKKQNKLNILHNYAPIQVMYKD